VLAFAEYLRAMNVMHFVNIIANPLVEIV